MRLHRRIASASMAIGEITTECLLLHASRVGCTVNPLQDKEERKGVISRLGRSQSWTFFHPPRLTHGRDPFFTTHLPFICGYSRAASAAACDESFTLKRR